MYCQHHHFYVEGAGDMFPEMLVTTCETRVCGITAQKIPIYITTTIKPQGSKPVANIIL
jgi:hypothetical protein